MSVWRTLIAHLFSAVSIYHHVNAKAPALAFSFNELGDEASLVGIAVILPELRLLIQQYFDIMDNVGSLYGQ